MMDHRRLSKRPAFLGLAVNLLKTLSDDQVQELARNMARDQRELEDEMLAGTEQETAGARAERTTVRLQRQYPGAGGELGESPDDFPSSGLFVWLRCNR